MPLTSNSSSVTTRPLRRADTGQALTEYGLILALIAVITIGAALFLGAQTSGTLSDVGGRIQEIPGVEVQATTPPTGYTTKKTCKAAGYTWVGKQRTRSGTVPAHCT